MADEMDDGVVNEICEEGGLGFTPQRRHLCNKLLPYFDQLDNEISSQLYQIKNNLSKAIVFSDVRNAGLYWTGKLHRFIKLYSYCFSKDDHIRFIKILYELVITPREDVWVTIRFAQTLLLLLKKVSLLTPNELELPWRPLYDLHRRVFHNADAYIGILRYPNQSETSISSVVRHCRPYFPPGSTEQMLEEFLPHLCPLDEQNMRYIKYMDMFLPVVKRHDGAPPKHHLWRQFVLDIIRNSPAWENHAISLLSRLAWKNIGTVDWEDELTIFFSKVLRYFKLPVNYKGFSAHANRDYDSTSFAMFIVANLGGGSSCQLQLSRLIGVIHSYLHPSNTGCWTSSIVDFISKLTLYFNKRYNRERRQSEDHCWDSSIPASKRLTEEDIDSFVSCLLPSTLIAIFGKHCAYEACNILNRLAALRPALVLPKFLDLIYPALESTTEPVRLHSCLQAALLTARTLVTSGSSGYPAGPTHVLPIMKMLLPAIDQNDYIKTLESFQLITTYCSLIPLVDCSKAVGTMELTEVEIELCEQSAELQDFLLVLLERCFNLVESCAGPSASQSGFTDSSINYSGRSNMSKEDMQLENGLYITFRSIALQCHPSIAEVLVKRLVRYAVDHTLEIDVAARLFGAIVRALSMSASKAPLLCDSLVPQLCNKLLALTASEAVRQEERPDSEIVYNIYLLADVCQPTCNALVPHVPLIIETLQQCLLMTNVATRKLASSVVSSMLFSLSCTIVTDNRIVTHPWDAPFAEFLPVRHWGALVTGGWQAMEMKWQQPGEKEAQAVSKIIHTFLVPELDRLDAASQNLSSISKEDLQHSINLIQNILTAGSLFPAWEEEPIPLYSNSVGWDNSSLVLSSAPVTVQLNAPNRPSNVRKAICETVLGLTQAMLDADSDNTIVYNSCINVLWGLQMHYSIKRTDFESRWRSLSASQRNLRNNLLGPQQHWYRVRLVMTQRATLQHISRTLEHIETRPFTATHGAILDIAFSLATSNYSQVRKASQKMLMNMFSQFPCCHLRLVSVIKSNLALDPNEHHKKFKGTLYVLHGAKTKGVMVHREWEVLSELWPAIVAAKHSEKQSMINLYNALYENVRHVEQLCLRHEVPEQLMDKGMELCKDWSVAVSSEEISAGAIRMNEQNQMNLRLYHSLLANISKYFSTGLPWKFQQICLYMLLHMIRRDEPFPAHGTSCVLESLVHDNLLIRRIATYTMRFLLRNQKRKHLKIPFDPTAVAAIGETTTEVEDITPRQTTGSPLIDRFIRPGVDRPDNKWLQYDPKFVDMTEELYEERRYIHRTYFGFTSWPTEVEVYAPPSQQPSLNRSPDEMTEAERVVYEFFTNPDKVDKLMKNFSMEFTKPQLESFDLRRMYLFHGIARNFGISILPLLVPHIEKLAADNTEASQRCCAEVIAGLVRGTKHWPFNDWQKMMTLTITTLKTAFSKMSAVGVDNWYHALVRISADRDPNLLAPIFELLLDISDINATSSFNLQSRLYLCSGFIYQQQWRVMSVLHRLVDLLRPSLSHPYKAVRDRMSLMLFYCFSTCSKLFYDGKCGIEITGQYPNLDNLIDYVISELGSLQEFSGGGHSSDGSKSGLAVLMSDGCKDSSCQDSPGIGGRHSRHMLPGMVSASQMDTGASSPAHDGDDHSNDRPEIMEEESSSQEADNEYVADDDSENAVEDDKLSRTEQRAVEHSGQLPSPSFDCAIAVTDERKNAFRIINTVCSFIQYSSNKPYVTSHSALYKLLGALCQLESVDSEQEVCTNCVAALCSLGYSIIRPSEVLDVLNRFREVSQYRWWRARSAALGVLQLKVFYNSITMMSCPGAPEIVLQIVLDRLVDERVEVRTMASDVLSSLLHISFIADRDVIRKRFIKTLRQKMRGVRNSSKKSSWTSEDLTTIHGSVLGLTAFVDSAPYTIPQDLPNVLVTLADYINLPQPISGSVKDCLSNFKRTHHDNWREHKLHFTPEQLDMLSDLLLSPSYYA